MKVRSPHPFCLTIYNHSLKVMYYTPWPRTVFSYLSGQRLLSHLLPLPLFLWPSLKLTLLHDRLSVDSFNPISWLTGSNSNKPIWVDTYMHTRTDLHPQLPTHCTHKHTHTHTQTHTHSITQPPAGCHVCTPRLQAKKQPSIEKLLIW